MHKINQRQKIFKEFVIKILESYGEDTKRDGLRETPVRVSKMYEELLCGYSQNPESVFKTFKSNGFHDMVTLTNINFYSLCEHHMVPFFGTINIGYLPDERILGLSKFARLTEIFSRRLQTQENLTNQIADSLEKNLKPKGLIVTIEATHLCMSMRGVKKNNLITKTTSVKGMLKRKPILVNQFFRELAQNKK